MSLVILYYMMQIIDPSSFILGFFWGGGFLHAMQRQAENYNHRLLGLYFLIYERQLLYCWWFAI